MGFWDGVLYDSVVLLDILNNGRKVNNSNRLKTLDQRMACINSNPTLASFVNRENSIKSKTGYQHLNLTLKWNRIMIMIEFE